SLAAAAQGPGQVGAEGGIDLADDRLEGLEVDVEGLGVGLLAGGVAESGAGLGDRGDAGRGGEQDSQEDGSGDLALGAEIEVRLAEVEGAAIDLGGCQWGGRLAHSGLRDEGLEHKSLSEKCLSWPSPATSLTHRIREY